MLALIRRLAWERLRWRHAFRGRPDDVRRMDEVAPFFRAHRRSSIERGLKMERDLRLLEAWDAHRKSSEGSLK